MLINNCLARLSSSLRPTTRECVYLVMRGHFRLRDKDGGHTIQSVIAYNPISKALTYEVYTCTSGVSPGNMGQVHI